MKTDNIGVIEHIRSDLSLRAIEKGMRPSRAYLIYGLSEALLGHAEDLDENSLFAVAAIRQFSRELVEFEDADGWPERPQPPKQ